MQRCRHCADEVYWGTFRDFSRTSDADDHVGWRHSKTGEEICLPTRAFPRPVIVVLCGSTKFFDEFRRQNLCHTLEGKIVLSIGCNTKDEHDLELLRAVEDGKVRLDELHKRKIDLADEVFIIDVDGYLGDSTRSEIEYAATRGKPVTYLSNELRSGRSTTTEDAQ